METQLVPAVGEQRYKNQPKTVNNECSLVFAEMLGAGDARWDFDGSSFVPTWFVNSTLVLRSSIV